MVTLKMNVLTHGALGEGTSEGRVPSTGLGTHDPVQVAPRGGGPSTAGTLCQDTASRGRM